MKKTIALVGSGVVSIPPLYGGATELIIYEIARAMPKDKYDVYVFDRKDGNKDMEVVHGAVYIRCKVPKFNNVFLLRLTEFIFGVKAMKKLRSLPRVSVVHTHTVFTALPLALFKFLLGEAKLVYTCHNPAWTEDKTDLFNYLIKKIEFYVMRKSDFVTTVSDTMRKNIIKAGISGRKTFRIYNFVDTKEFSPQNKNYWKKRDVHGPVVFFVSKLIPNKGVEYLIRSASIVRKRIPHVKYVITGPKSFEYESQNPWPDLVKELGLGNMIIFTGKMDREDLPHACASSDIFCFPTLKESFGMVLVEAMSCGLPVVSSDIPVVREVTGGNAILVKPKDAKGIAKAVIEILTNKKMRKKLSAHSLKRSEAFEKKGIMEQYERFYQRLCHA